MDELISFDSQGVSSFPLTRFLKCATCLPCLSHARASPWFPDAATCFVRSFRNLLQDVRDVDVNPLPRRKLPRFSSHAMSTQHFSDRFYEESRRLRGPVRFLNPTRTHFLLPRRTAEPPSWPPGPIYQVWRSRDNRKGRHAAVAWRQHVDKRIHLPRATNTLVETARGMWRMVVRYPVWDISYDVAIMFTLGMTVKSTSPACLQPP